MSMPDELTTPRLRLRPYRWQDLDDIMAYATSETWARYLPVPWPYTRRDGERFLASQVLLDREREPCWAIEFEGHVVGGVNLRLSFEHRLGELGYALAEALWGRGLTTEAVRVVVASAFETYPDLNRIRASADARNVGSLRVMEKLGMTREGHLRQNRLFRGELTDEVWCGLLRDEWSGVPYPS
jgi:ribosomal-protein-alanine N-acetyltransferase